MIWTIIELEEDIMVLNNVTKFHKNSDQNYLTKRADIISNGRTDRGNTDLLFPRHDNGWGMINQCQLFCEYHCTHAKDNKKYVSKK